MCGIVGKVTFDGAPIDGDWLHAACDLIAHRGPDGERVAIENDGRASIALGHRRLRIIDLRPTADQPMHNTGCRGDKADLTIVFNGEIYNYLELRRDLQSRGHRFATDSDTEVILHLYEEQGTRAVEALRGMFAFALWDRSQSQLMLARDRVGKKPLYYRHDGARAWFASEARAILADPEVPIAVNHQAVRSYLTLGYVPGPDSAFAGLRRLPPAHVAVINRSGIRLERYWSLAYQPKIAIAEADAIAEVRRCLEESVRLRLISDVPLGAFLSGGIDSSAVVALMCRLGGRVKTFSIGFDDDRFNELAYARTVAGAFKTDHHEFIVKPELTGLLPRLAWHYGEPFADSSAVPMYHLARLAREHITVALTGDGGDESFAGYRRYVAERLLARSDHPLARRIAAWALRALPAAAESRSRLYDLRRLLAGMNQRRERRYAEWFGFFDPNADILDPDFARTTSESAALAPLADAFESHRSLDAAEAAMAADVATYLPDDLLVKADIATMAHGLEARSPLLDQELMKFAAGLPARMKLPGRSTKAFLRRALQGLVPDSILSRGKMGFGVPLDTWLRTSLREMTADLLLSGETRPLGYLSGDGVARLVNEHLSGTAAHGHRIWALLMLRLWHEHAVEPARRRVPAPAAEHARFG